MLTNAAREGARVAVLPGATDGAVRTRVLAYMEAGGLPNSRAEPDHRRRRRRDRHGRQAVSASRVTIDYPFSFMVLQPVMQLVAPGSDVGEAITMTASALMRNESPN